MRFAQVKNTAVANIIQLDDVAQTQKFLVGFDFIVDVTDNKLVAKGWLYDSVGKKFMAPPEPVPIYSKILAADNKIVTVEVDAPENVIGLQIPSEVVDKDSFIEFVLRSSDKFRKNSYQITDFSGLVGAQI